MCTPNYKFTDMSANLTPTYQEDLFEHIEPIFIEHFKHQHGNSPSIMELKQHLVSTSIDRLIDHLKSLNTRLTASYSHSELSRSIQLYIRKLK